MSNIKEFKVHAHHELTIPFTEEEQNLLIDSVSVVALEIRDYSGKTIAHNLLSPNDYGRFIPQTGIDPNIWQLHFENPSVINDIPINGILNLSNPKKIKITSSKNITCTVIIKFKV